MQHRGETAQRVTGLIRDEGAGAARDVSDMTWRDEAGAGTRLLEVARGETFEEGAEIVMLCECKRR